MDPIEFAKFVNRMRDSQRKFFDSRSPGELKKARDIEKEVDRELKDIFRPRLLLSDPGDPPA
jgi:hypothetical protein